MSIRLSYFDSNPNHERYAHFTPDKVRSLLKKGCMVFLSTNNIWIEAILENGSLKLELGGIGRCHQYRDGCVLDYIHDFSTWDSHYLVRSC